MRSKQGQRNCNVVLIPSLDHRPMCKAKGEMLAFVNDVTPSHFCPKKSWAARGSTSLLLSVDVGVKTFLSHHFFFFFLALN